MRQERKQTFNGNLKSLAGAREPEMQQAKGCTGVPFEPDSVGRGWTEFGTANAAKERRGSVFDLMLVDDQQKAVPQRMNR